jgi:hypothetical protein
MPRERTKKHLQTAEVRRPRAVALNSVARSVGAIAGAVAASAASVLGNSKVTETPEQPKSPKRQNGEKRRRSVKKQPGRFAAKSE